MGTPRFHYHFTEADEREFLEIAGELPEDSRQTLLRALQEIATLRQELRHEQRDLREATASLEAYEQNAMDRDLLT
jgi:hypothetical protein